MRDRYEPIHQKALTEAKSLYEELTPKLRGNCLGELHLHAWAFTDKPDILTWMRDAAGREKSEEARLLLKKLGEIDAYNAKRTRPLQSSASGKELP